MEESENLYKQYVCKAYVREFTHPPKFLDEIFFFSKTAGAKKSDDSCQPF